MREPFVGRYKAVRGSYWVTYRIVEQHVVVEVVRVAHRSDVYRP